MLELGSFSLGRSILDTWGAQLEDPGHERHRQAFAASESPDSPQPRVHWDRQGAHHGGVRRGKAGLSAATLCYDRQSVASVPGCLAVSLSDDPSVRKVCLAAWLSLE